VLRRTVGRFRRFFNVQIHLPFVDVVLTLCLHSVNARLNVDDDEHYSLQVNVYNLACLYP